MRDDVAEIAEWGLQRKLGGETSWWFYSQKDRLEELFRSYRDVETKRSDDIVTMV